MLILGHSESQPEADSYEKSVVIKMQNLQRPPSSSHVNLLLYVDILNNDVNNDQYEKLEDVYGKTSKLFCSVEVLCIRVSAPTHAANASTSHKNGVILVR